MFRIAQSALEFFTLPEAAQIKVVNVPDLSDLRRESEGWACGLGVATAFGGKFSDARRWQLLFNFVRRVEGAIDQFETGRHSLLSVPGQRELATYRYLLAVMHFESCVSQTYQALMLFAEFGKTGKLFERGDGTTFQRLNLLYNRSKHVEKAIAAGQLPEDMSLPVTVTADALVSSDARVDFSELAETLRVLGKGAGDVVGGTFFRGGDKVGEHQDDSLLAERLAKIGEDW